MSVIKLCLHLWLGHTVHWPLRGIAPVTAQELEAIQAGQTLERDAAQDAARARDLDLSRRKITGPRP